MRKIGISQAEVDATKIIEDSEDYLVVPATIAREGIFPYPEGLAFKPKEELRKSTWTADGAWIVPEKHPDTILVVSPDQIIGRVEKPVFCDKANGIHAQLRFDKKRSKPEFIADIKAGKKKDVSIGFTYEFDPTPGEFSGQHYDFVQRNLLINHVAAGMPVGRCPSPYCGIAVDQLIRKVAADPWEETEDYIRSGHKEPGETCRTIDISEDQGIKAIYCKYGEDWAIQSYLFSKAKDWTVEKAKTWFAEHKQAADAESIEAIRAKIRDLAKKQVEISAKLYPRPEGFNAEQASLQAELTVISAELWAYQEIFKVQLTRQGAADAADCLDPYKQIERTRRLLES